MTRGPLERFPKLSCKLYMDWSKGYVRRGSMIYIYITIFVRYIHTVNIVSLQKFQSGKSFIQRFVSAAMLHMGVVKQENSFCPGLSKSKP